MAKHQHAAAATQKYLDEAQNQLAEATSSAAAARADADKLLTSSKAEAKSTIEAARASAADTVKTAEKRAKDLVSEAEKRAKTLLGDAEDRLVQIRLERESVAGYLQNLRGVLASAETLAADHGFPAGPQDDAYTASVEVASGDDRNEDDLDEEARAREVTVGVTNLIA